MKHELKILPVYFDAVMSGEKTFEIRDNRDRGFQKGDVVVFREYGPIPPSVYRYTGRDIQKTITYVSNYEQRTGWVVFSIKDIT